jgi:hypothetical protein
MLSVFPLYRQFYLNFICTITTPVLYNILFHDSVAGCFFALSIKQRIDKAKSRFSSDL